MILSNFPRQGDGGRARGEPRPAEKLTGRYSYDGPGIYRHYKGGIYLAEGLVTIEATGSLAVLYQPITPEGREATARDFVTMRYVRPLDDFNAHVEGDFVLRSGERSLSAPRFEKISS